MTTINQWVSWEVSGGTTVGLRSVYNEPYLPNVDLSSGDNTGFLFIFPAGPVKSEVENRASA